MSCDAGRPCGRCVKRDIAHLCRDEPAVGGPAPPPPSLPPAAVVGEGSSPVVARRGSIQGASGSGRNEATQQRPAGISPMPVLSGGLQYGAQQGGYAPPLPLLTANFNLAMVSLGLESL
jgi:hypothetical protein